MAQRSQWPPFVARLFAPLWNPSLTGVCPLYGLYPPGPASVPPVVAHVRSGPGSCHFREAGTPQFAPNAGLCVSIVVSIFNFKYALRLREWVHSGDDVDGMNLHPRPITHADLLKLYLSGITTEWRAGGYVHSTVQL